jgi:hypothetical protein
MNKEEFYRRYANVPISERQRSQEGLTLNNIFEGVSRLDDEMRSKKVRQDGLLHIAWRIFEQL